MIAAFRSNEGLGFVSLVNNHVLDSLPTDLPLQNPKSATYSADGRLFGYICAEGVVVLSADTQQLLRLIPIPGVQSFSFSPRGTYVATYERLVKSDTQPPPNVVLWSLETGESVLQFCHKNPDTWAFQWTEDESHCLRMVHNEVQVYGPSNWSKTLGKLTLEGVAEFSVSPGKNPCIAVFVPEKQGAPAIVRLYGLLSFNYPLSNKSFYKADTVKFYWNSIGTNVLVLTHTDTDTARQSYYGETNLYYLSAVGNYDCRVSLDAEGPVHDIAWAPSAVEFTVVYGNMPAKAAIFDARANKIFDFGQSPKNYCRYSPQGRLVLLAGFGNLAGYIEVWDRKKLVKLSQFKEDSAVYCEFLPFEGRILTATLSPRLRVDNRLRVRSYSGEILWQLDFKELFQLLQRPTVSQRFPDENGLVLKVTAAQSKAPSSAGSTASSELNGGGASDLAPKAYVPPHLRRRMEQQGGVAAAVKSGPPGSNGSLSKQQKKQQNRQPAAAVLVTEKAKQPAQAAVEINGVAGEIVKLEKQILGVQRKLRQLDQLKEKQTAGETLEKNQQEKLSTEPALQDQLKALEDQLAKIQLTA